MRELERKLKLLEEMSKLTQDEYYELCEETMDEDNYFSNPVSIIKFSNKYWSFKNVQ